jgi:pectate lyase
MKRPILICVAVLASLYMVGPYMANELYAQHSAGGGASVHGASARPTSSTKGSTGGQKTPSELLQDNKNLSNKLSTILAKQGITNIQQAAQGFKNLGIPFTSLKTDMMNGDSLGKAIHALKPAVDSQTESKRGLKQANEDIKESESKS